MRIRGLHRLRTLIEQHQARRFVASLDRGEYKLPDEVRDRIQKKLQAILDENILPFWFPACVDLKSRGYLAECSLSGEWQPLRNKNLVSQSRTLWFASRLINFGRTSDDNIRWAEHGFEYLRDYLWDRECGGFYWEIDLQTGRPAKPDKHLYGQAYALYALSEFALATGNESARQMADQLFEIVDTHAHDATNGGYNEFFRRDWKQPDTDEPSYMGHPPGIKQLNTHLHLLEAFTGYANLSDSELIRKRLTELILIQSTTVVSKEGGGCTDVFSSDWKRHSAGKFNRVTYGHDFENIWMLIEANRALGASNAPFMELYEHLFLTSVRYGWDRTNSGFYFRGRMLKLANERNKVWWTQAEALLGTLHMYALTGQAMYFQLFDETLGWIDRRQIDWSDGEWYLVIEDKSGIPSGGKATDANWTWKSPYHNGRAVVHCIELLTE